MYTIYLCTILGLIVGLTVSKFKFNEIVAPLMIFCIVMGAIIGLACSTTIMTLFVPRHNVVYGPRTLISIRSADSLSGSFLLGSGGLGYGMTYTFYVKNDDGSVTPEHLDADTTVRIIEDKSLQDVGYWRTTIKEFDHHSAMSNWALTLDDESRVVDQEFRVPVGTVVHSFNLK